MTIEATKELVNHTFEEIQKLIQMRNQQFQQLCDFTRQVQSYTKISHSEMSTLRHLLKSFNQTYDKIEQKVAYVEGVLEENKNMTPLIIEINTINSSISTQQKQLQQLSLQINDRFR